MTFTEIKNRVYFLTGNPDFPIADLVRSANSAVEHVVAKIDRCDKSWQFDDLNHPDTPIATATLTASQQSYTLSASHLTIDRVEVKDSSGTWHLLTQLDQQSLKGERGMALAGYQNVPGVPAEYDLSGATIYLYPAPSYTQAASLKVYYTRPPLPFDSDDTTEQPGFNSLFHDLVPLWIAYDYAMAFGKENARGLYAEIERKEAELTEFHALRNRDARPRISTSTDSNK